MYNIEVKFCDNPDKFRPAAVIFDKYGYYTAHPRGTTAYKEYWREQRRYCLEGFTTEDGEFITGYFYFYLNFCPIYKLIRKERTLKNGKVITVLDRIKNFPNYYDYDRAYYDAIQEAEENGKHLVVIKARNKGYSFKGASMLCRNYFLIPGSNSWAVAAEQNFLIKDGLLTKAWEMMSFIDEHTAWGKKRQKTDTKLHKKASYLAKDSTGKVIEKGYMSEIGGITLKNDIQKIRGIRGKLILWEESGRFPGLKEAWQIARSSVEASGSGSFGLMLSFGTGGSESANYEGLKDLFYEPEAYNALEIENTWDEGSIGKASGFFAPQYYNMEGVDDEGNPFMDAYGNSNLNTSIQYEATKRQTIVKTASDRSTIDRYVAERPNTPAEATLQISSNIFPKADLMAHLAQIRNNTTIQSYKQVGDLEWQVDGSLKWLQAAHPKDIIKYRMNKAESKHGQIVIWEHPPTDMVPSYGLYIAGVDPYDHDKSTTDSLLSCFIYKRYMAGAQYCETLVAEYTGRPEMADEAYENVRKLLMYYHAICLYENEKKGLFTYFSHKHCEYLLSDQPQLLKDIIKDMNVSRGKGTHMNKFIKQYGEGLVKDWLNEEIEPGVKNLTKILSEPLLEELIDYNDEGNFDRVISFILVMILREEFYHITVKERKKENKATMLFPEGIFRETAYKSNSLFDILYNGKQKEKGLINI